MIIIDKPDTVHQSGFYVYVILKHGLTNIVYPF